MEKMYVKGREKTCLQTERAAVEFRGQSLKMPDAARERWVSPW